MSLFRSVAFAGAVAGLVGAALVTGVGSAANSDASSFVPIVPCRLVDTRPASQVGPRATPLGPDTTATFAVHGANGNCTIPSTAIGIATNTTAVNPTAASFLTVFPADAPTRPTASNLNYEPGSPPTPNQVTVGLSVDGKVNVFNRFGDVDVVIDVVGYYVAAATGGPPQLHVGTAGNVALLQPGGEQTSVTSVSVPPGTYHATYTVGVVNFTTNGDLHRCWLEAGGVELLGLTTAQVGDGADVITLSGQAEISVAGAPTSPIELVCAHDNNRFSTNSAQLLYVENATVSALEVAP